MPFYGEVLVGVVILVGLLGIVIPVLPGSLMVGGSILTWAAIVGGKAWLVFAVAAVIILIGEVCKYLAAGRVLRSAGIPNLTIIVGGVVGIVGFFVVPVIGLFAGFVLGAMVAELVRTRSARSAWRGTISAIKASVYTIGIELFAALLAAGLWVGSAFVW